jgi:hypothetical protein
MWSVLVVVDLSELWAVGIERGFDEVMWRKRVLQSRCRPRDCVGERLDLRVTSGKRAQTVDRMGRSL